MREIIKCLTKKCNTGAYPLQPWKTDYTAFDHSHYRGGGAPPKHSLVLSQYWCIIFTAFAHILLHRCITYTVLVHRIQSIEGAEQPCQACTGTGSKDPHSHERHIYFMYRLSFNLIFCLKL